jgi:hypothetical protein
LHKKRQPARCGPPPFNRARALAITALTAVLAALLATLAALLPALAGFLLPALVLLAGLLLPAAALLATLLVALRVVLLLLIALGIVLPLIIRHWTFSGLSECESLPARHGNAGRAYSFHRTVRELSPMI